MQCNKWTAAMTIFAILTMGCGDDDKPTAASGSSDNSGSIVGIWEAELKGDLSLFLNEWLFEFRAGGIVVQNSSSNTGLGILLGGSVARYEQSGNKVTFKNGKEITFQRTGSGSWTFDENILDEESVNFKLSGDVLEAHAVDGEVFQFHRSTKTVLLPQEALNMIGE